MARNSGKGSTPPVIEFGPDKIKVTNLEGVQAILSSKAKKKKAPRQYTAIGARQALSVHGIPAVTTVGDENYYEVARVEALPIHPLRGRAVPVTQADLAQKRKTAMDLMKTEMTHVEIAREVGIATSTLYRWLKREEAS